MTTKKTDMTDVERVKKLYDFENAAYSDGYKFIAGTDEAGRGSLVGPVTVAAVILPPNIYIPKLNDSKKLSARRREVLYDEITAVAVSFSCVEVSVEEVDTLNVYRATLEGMVRAVKKLSVQPDFVLTDAMKIDFGEDISSRSVVRGDSLSASIAAASIIAKVTRDRMADEWSKKFPEYGFEHNRGYGTKEHLAALEKFGATPIHRKTFAPVKYMMSNAVKLWD